ncbi:MAG: hypothetical protein AAFN77_17750 [Planctomycetota bacterium]
MSQFGFTSEATLFWKRQSSGWLIVCTTILLMPLMITTGYAQDVEAVQRRLMKSVKKDGLSLEQAAMMIEVLKETMHDEHSEHHDEHMEHEHDEHMEYEHDEHMEHEHDEHEHHANDDHDHEHDELDHAENRMHVAIEQIKLAVLRREMSPDEARKKIQAMEQQFARHREEIEHKREHAEHEAHEHEAHEHEAHEHEAHEHEAHEHEHEMELAERKVHNAIREIENAVRQGKLSEEAAEKKIHEIHEQFRRYHQEWEQKRRHEADHGEHVDHGDERNNQRRRRMEIGIQQIKQAVADGKVSREDAARRIEAMKAALESGSRPGGEKAQREKEEEKRQYYAEAEEKMEAMVREGNVTKAQSEARLAALKDHLWPSKDSDERTEGEPVERRMEQLKRRLEIAIERGRISEAEAAERMREMMRRMRQQEEEEEYEDDDKEDDDDR